MAAGRGLTLSFSEFDISSSIGTLNSWVVQVAALRLSSLVPVSFASYGTLKTIRSENQVTPPLKIWLRRLLDTPRSVGLYIEYLLVGPAGQGLLAEVGDDGGVGQGLAGAHVADEEAPFVGPREISDI